MYCATCGEQMLCMGRAQPDPNVMYFDGFHPGPCAREGRSDRRTYEQIMEAADAKA